MIAFAAAVIAPVTCSGRGQCHATMNDAHCILQAIIK